LYNLIHSTFVICWEFQQWLNQLKIRVLFTFWDFDINSH
jgi:hypothetical protein